VADVTRPVAPIVALDVADAPAAVALAEALGDSCPFYKIGGELFTAEGPSIVRTIRDRGASVFLDLKFHDIPNTVRSAVRSAARLGVRLVTVHASGGLEMLRAAVAAARESNPDCGVLAVTVLTSLNGEALARVWGRPVADLTDEVLRLAETAAEAGAHGIVCSGLEARRVRDRFGDALATLVPGVRLGGGEHHDQARVVTPRDAAAAGARYIVLGRTVTAAESPRDAMKAVLADLS
jgi:orotidine-5'-phosphate decarboxylase